MTHVWVRFREREALLRHYERHTCTGRSRVFAEADMYRACEDVWTHTFRALHLSPHHHGRGSELDRARFSRDARKSQTRPR